MLGKSNCLKKNKCNADGNGVNVLPKDREMRQNSIFCGNNYDVSEVLEHGSEFLPGA
jgi:hypothetical protein